MTSARPCGRSDRGRLRARWPAGLPLTAAIAVALVSAVAACWTGSAGRGPGAASAEVLPPDCGPTVGTAAASIRIQAVPPEPKDGDVLAYRVGASYPAPARGIGCTVFDVDVFIKTPGSSAFRFACNLPALASGTGTVECPGAVRYTIAGADRTASGDLIATIHVMGNKHDRAADCIFETSPRNPTRIDPCFDASAISRLSQADTPTPTPTPTDTPVPTNTALPTEAPIQTDTPESLEVPPTVSEVLGATTSHGAGTPLGQIVLPATGSPAAGGAWRWLLAALAIAAGGIGLAGEGRRMGRSRR